MRGSTPTRSACLPSSCEPAADWLLSCPACDADKHACPVTHMLSRSLTGPQVPILMSCMQHDSSCETSWTERLACSNALLPDLQVPEGTPSES